MSAPNTPPIVLNADILPTPIPARLNRLTMILIPTGNEIPDNILDKYIVTNLFTMDHYIPGIMSIIYGDNTAYKAITEIEGIPGLNFN